MQKGFSNILVIILAVFLIIALGIGLNLNKNKSHNSLPQKSDKSTVQEEKQSVKTEADRMVEYFLRDNLSEFPILKSLVPPSIVKRVFPVSFKNENGISRQQAWLVEIEKSPNIYTYYLLTPTFEKELLDAMSTTSEDREATCLLEKVTEIGNEMSLGRNLKEKNGYVALSGSKCMGYGASGMGFVSIYSLGTGEKIRFQGDFSLPPSNFLKGVSKNGNALGVLR